jgi:hypothetical protein
LTLQDKHTFAALDQAFGTDVTPVPERPLTAPMVEDDFDQARQTLKRLIDKGESALDDMMTVARQSDHPRAFEVTGQLIKTVAETAKDLLALQKAKRDLVAPEEAKPQQIGTQNNIVFSGNTTELIKMLRQRNEHIIENPSSKTA